MKRFLSLFIVLAGFAMACVTAIPRPRPEGWRDIAEIISKIRASGLMPLDELQVANVVTDHGGSFSSSSHWVYGRPVDDLLWTSTDGNCSIEFDASEPNSKRYTHVVIRCDAVTRRHAENMLLTWLAELDPAYARRLRQALPGISGDLNDEFLLGQGEHQTRVQFDVRLFKDEGWNARLELQ